MRSGFLVIADERHLAVAQGEADGTAAAEIIHKIVIALGVVRTVGSRQFLGRRADTDAAAESALNARNWTWLSLNAASVKNSELQLKICLTATRELSDREEVSGILLKTVPSMDEMSTAALINELAQAGKWELCEDLFGFADTSAADSLLRLAAGKPEARNAASIYSAKASREAIAAFMQSELDRNA